MRRLITILLALVLLSTNAWAFTKPINVRDYNGTYQGVPNTGIDPDTEEDYFCGTLYRDNQLDPLCETGGEGQGSHPGVDIPCDVTDDIYSIAAGTVYISAYDEDGWGNYIVIRHDIAPIGVFYSSYAHLSQRFLSSGSVSEGQIIGKAGNTGNSTGTHLHFQIDRANRLDNNASFDTHPIFPLPVNSLDTGHMVENYTINPMGLLQMNEYEPSYIPVGFAVNEDYSGYPKWTTEHGNLSQKFRDRYDDFVDEEETSLGFPWTNPDSPDWIDYPQAVHQINESMWIQDFYSLHNGFYNPHSSLIMEYGGDVVLLKEGFWDLWINNKGWLNFGPPVTEEDDYPSPGSAGKQQVCDLEGTPFYLRWVPGDQTRVYDQYNNEVDLDNLQFMPDDNNKMVMADGGKPLQDNLPEYPEMVIEADGRSGGGSRKGVVEIPVRMMDDGLKSLQSDGVYHSEIRLSGFGENIPLVNGRTYDSFYIVYNGQEFPVNPFTVSGDATIQVDVSNPMPEVQFGYWTIQPDPGNIGQQLTVEGNIYNGGSATVNISEARVELLDPNGNEVYHWSEYNVSLDPSDGWWQYMYCYPYMAGNHTARFRILIGSEWTVLSTRTVYVEGNQLTAQFSANVRLGDIPLAVQFTDLSSGNPTSWSWDFGDGNLSTAQNPSHIYNMAGTYAVRLDVYDSYSSDFEVKYNYITVTDVLNADFTSDVTSGLAPLQVQFTDQSSGSPTSWLWNFGDGTTSSTQNPGHLYSVAGIYNVSLTVNDQSGSDTMTKSGYVVVGGLHADFSADRTSIGAGELVRFTDLSTGDPTSWTWDFGDGTVITYDNGARNHTYMNPGVYTVTLTVENNMGSDVEVKIDYITVGESVLSFTADVVSGRVPLTVNFAGSAPGNSTQWCWDFGDGTITGLPGGQPCTQYISHVYEEAGTYDVGLVVVDGNGMSVYVIYEDFITVEPSFTADVSEGLNPLTVNFTDESGFSASTWSWDFGDGGTSTAQNPTYVYNTAGYYTVTFVAGTGPGALTVVRENYIHVADSDMGFEADVTYGSPPLTVHFTNLSLGNPIIWGWAFGDGGESIDENPTHTYNSVGTYSVMLLAFYGAYTDTLIYEDYINVVNQVLDANFSSDVTSGAAPLQVQFTDQSLGSPTSWLWNFGDGTTSTLQSPGHTYESGGTYTVSLTVSSGAAVDSLSQADFITVSSAIDARFTSNVTQGIAPMQVQFTDQSLGSPTSWLWNFGDGGTSTEQNPTHTYSTVGTYDVSLTAGNGTDSDVVNKNEYIRVKSLDADYNSDVTSGEIPLTVHFTDQSLGSPTSWLWNFGDGGTSTEQNPTHTYKALGSYNVSLTISDEAGSSYINRNDYVLVVDGLYALMTTNTSYGVASLSVHFYDQSLGSPTSWLWNFGDGGTSTEQNPTHTYSTVGTYDVSLTAVAGSDTSTTTIEGCVVTLGELSAYFAVDDTLGATPFVIHFTDQSSGSPTSWLWNFGDGGTSTEQNPTHTYSTVGTYDVSLLITSESGSNALVEENLITAIEPVVAEFTADHTSVYTGTAIHFTDQSTGNPTSWSWDFGNGATSTEQNPTYTYPIHGTYTVSLTASDGVSGDTMVKTDYISSTKPPEDNDVYPHSEPNPFNPTTVISFKLEQSGHVQVDIFDIAGRKVKGLLDQSMSAGVHKVTFDGRGLSSGAYFYMIRTANGHDVGKIMLMK